MAARKPVARRTGHNGAKSIPGKQIRGLAMGTVGGAQNLKQATQIADAQRKREATRAVSNPGTPKPKPGSLEARARKAGQTNAKATKRANTTGAKGL